MESNFFNQFAYLSYATAFSLDGLFTNVVGSFNQNLANSQKKTGVTFHQKQYGKY
ncbi:hypothetical protein [Leptospira paudalimensis]|uniref:Uncharacterized protein n=1 Tax=Leptospira paudalimensis TaxID=2950024 RepID=A0ABT3M3R3_9LEPT|nr:hypothetical protein [Leptospira paudalimensis]MCW7503005.1 hypothetical protein [Leptospira paudalimensis]